MAVNNYFSTMIHRYNGDEDFIAKIKPEQIQKSAKERIFREMVQGKIDYTVYGKYFLEPKFLENLIIAANDELLNKSVILKTLQFYDMNFPGDQLVVYNLTTHAGLVCVYQLLYNRLTILKSTGDIGCMVDIVHQLKDFKNII